MEWFFCGFITTFPMFFMRLFRISHWHFLCLFNQSTTTFFGLLGKNGNMHLQILIVLFSRLKWSCEYVKAWKIKAFLHFKKLSCWIRYIICGRILNISKQLVITNFIFISNKQLFNLDNLGLWTLKPEIDIIWPRMLFCKTFCLLFCHITSIN